MVCAGPSCKQRSFVRLGCFGSTPAFGHFFEMHSKRIVHQMMMDQETIKTLQAKSDNSNQIHRVEHHFTCSGIEPLMDLVQVCLELGFLETPIEQMDDDPDGNYYFTDLINETRIDYSRIARESLLMNALAEAFGCEYDGWGTEVEK